MVSIEPIRAVIVGSGDVVEHFADLGTIVSLWIE